MTNLYRLAPQPGGLVLHVVHPDSERRALCGAIFAAAPMRPGWPAEDLHQVAEQMNATICEECDAVDLTED